ncbi:hypothetical protein V3H24_23585 [Vibrio parahaemolyticus]|uniref:hypothetical protein n=1 Tax=Vibrio parahaemolyticus TaxID=670 RepID=UPI001120142A|nr:hypothetical protein [Vibrio parahaemolyticus]MCS0091662.1 hypothetical protein [Vibrio parahaemolyticus]TPA03581.1 hypothetical protein DXE03_24930 [Vibrio parahaemolyticus]
MDDLAREIQVRSKGMGSLLEVTNKKYHETNDSFARYVSEQCSMVGGSAMSRSLVSEHQDCELRLMHDRIDTLMYLLDQHYKE